MTHPTPLPAVELDAIGYSKRILALVDDHTDRPNKDTRADIRAQLLSDFDGLITALTAAQARAEAAPITDALISKAARFISDRQAKECGVNAQTNWDVYGDEFIEDVRDMFAHIGLKPDSAIGGKGA